MSTACPICAGSAATLGTRTVLKRHEGQYVRCPSCGFIWVANPDWLDEAYGTAITALDTGIAVRNLWLRDACCALLGTSLRDVRRILDHGGGTGLLVRLLRDQGHDAWWQDAYCENLLARGFEAQEGERFDLVTAFEVIEHLVDPMATLRELLTRAPRLLISTELPPQDPGRFFDWHYVAPEAGQHIAFFSRRSLEVAGETLGLRLSSNGRNLHYLGSERISERWLYRLRKPATAARWAWLGRRTSLAHSDADRQLQRLRSAATPP